mmetsp:Transcript_11527/g.17717  ORF Transcript_11527/g.17717 Transcript_11527/m.17717 type:complete len:221 (-) Transcript_11527:284-946(-)
MVTKFNCPMSHPFNLNRFNLHLGIRRPSMIGRTITPPANFHIHICECEPSKSSIPLAGTWTGYAIYIRFHRTRMKVLSKLSTMRCDGFRQVVLQPFGKGIWTLLGVLSMQFVDFLCSWSKGDLLKKGSNNRLLVLNIVTNLKGGQIISIVRKIQRWIQLDLAQSFPSLVFGQSIKTSLSAYHFGSRHIFSSTLGPEGIIIICSCYRNVNSVRIKFIIDTG